MLSWLWLFLDRPAFAYPAPTFPLPKTHPTLHAHLKKHPFKVSSVPVRGARKTTHQQVHNSYSRACDTPEANSTNQHPLSSSSQASPPSVPGNSPVHQCAGSSHTQSLQSASLGARPQTCHQNAHNSCGSVITGGCMQLTQETFPRHLVLTSGLPYWAPQTSCTQGYYFQGQETQLTYQIQRNKHKELDKIKTEEQSKQKNRTNPRKRTE